jgi:hypothetical protein
MGSGKILRYSIRKYGVENHTKEILEFLPTREELVLREIELVTKELISDGKCMNLKEGGQGGFSSEEHMIKCSSSGGKGLAKKRENDLEFKINYKQNHSNGLKRAYKEGKREKKYFHDWDGKKHSEESKILISEKMKNTGIGELNSQYGTCWITKDGTNKKIKKEDLETYLNEGWVQGRK